MNIAIILCCYNRKTMTKRCLTQLYTQIGEFQNEAFQIYVCDDNSTDGTTEMIETDFPLVYLLRGGGNLYWCKSMYEGMKAAVKDGYDLYLMINDDVDFDSNALRTMVNAYYEKGEKCAVVGAMKAVSKEVCTYGGRNINGKLIEPTEKMQECEWANWNCFLTDKDVIEQIGIIDGKYQHSWGDFDYSFRMRKAGLKIYIAPYYVGRCDSNSTLGSFRDNSVKRCVRIRKLLAPKGLPFYSYMRYHIRVFGRGGIFRYLYGYMSLIGYILLGKDIK